MNSWQHQGGQRMSIGPRGLTPAIKNIIIINIAVFLFLNLLGRNAGFLVHYFGLNPELVLTRVMIWQPVSYMFLHGGFMHLFMNMLMLWLFGTELEMLWGRREFYRFYFITGIGSGILSIVPYIVGVLTQGTSFSPVIIGASGAVYGILLAFALTWPDRTVYLYFIMPVKVKHLMIFMGIITFLSVGNRDGVSHVTHLGGLLVAWLYLRYHGNYRGFKLNLNWREWLKKLKKIQFVQDHDESKRGSGGSRRTNGWHKVNQSDDAPGGEDRDNARAELDHLLDKINRIGYEQLSEVEKKRLYELSQDIARHQPN
ncbi:MAG: rhomboid family intramembrane serine protease [Candidatus Marinimicrobia bacterium]|nr:rhomboid family intramembrane serine protease [Candidatus Neomarinimicrobiota bacterium]MCF7839358.1 rhomboid family intramembrane serine protease [Candidatus Neomarinimicrobiota bacterium]MCF7901961.1 rhomboid family intramembrane serine protease [Candidatus Neomarinimicrobiota bacterium]